MIDLVLASAMPSLDILLLDRLFRDERDVRLACGGADRFSVVAVVLLPAHKGFNLLRANDLHPVANCLKLTSQKNVPVLASTTIVQRARPVQQCR